MHFQHLLFSVGETLHVAYNKYRIKRKLLSWVETSKVSFVLRTRENSDVYNALDEIYFGIHLKKSKYPRFDVILSHILFAWRFADGQILTRFYMRILHNVYEWGSEWGLTITEIRPYLRSVKLAVQHTMPNYLHAYFFTLHVH